MMRSKYAGVVLLLLCTSSKRPPFKLPSSCNELPNGYHYLQLLTQDEMDAVAKDRIASVTRMQCSNGYAIINPNFDSNIQEFFTSYRQYHPSFSGPDVETEDSQISWSQWWLPALVDETASWSIAPDCDTCSDEALVYHMTGDFFGKEWPTSNLCDFDEDTLECYSCKPEGHNGTELSGTCGHMSVAAPNVEPKIASQGTSQPSIGTNGQFCVCYRSSPAHALLKEGKPRTINIAAMFNHKFPLSLPTPPGSETNRIHQFRNELRDRIKRKLHEVVKKNEDNTSSLEQGKHSFNASMVWLGGVLSVIGVIIACEMMRRGCNKQTFQEIFSDARKIELLFPKT